MPFVSERAVKSETIVKYKVLTAHMGTGLKLGGHVRIHRYHDLLFVGHQSVPFFDLVVHPQLEFLANYGGTDVDNPLLWHLLQVGLVRQIRLDPWAASHKF